MRLSKIHTVLMILALSGAGGLGGCGLFNSNTGPLIVDTRSPISDVPVPAGFAMTDDSSSKVITSSSLRVVDHGYKGSDDLLPVVTFYKEQIPKKDWNFIDQTQVSGKEITLHFTKRSEDCHITVRERVLDTMIRVKIDPLSR